MDVNTRYDGSWVFCQMCYLGVNFERKIRYMKYSLSLRFFKRCSYRVKRFCQQQTRVFSSLERYSTYPSTWRWTFWIAYLLHGLLSVVFVISYNFDQPAYIQWNHVNHKCISKKGSPRLILTWNAKFTSFQEATLTRGNWKRESDPLNNGTKELHVLSTACNNDFRIGYTVLTCKIVQTRHSK